MVRYQISMVKVMLQDGLYVPFLHMDRHQGVLFSKTGPAGELPCGGEVDLTHDAPGLRGWVLCLDWHNRQGRAQASTSIGRRAADAEATPPPLYVLCVVARYVAALLLHGSKFWVGRRRVTEDSATPGAPIAEVGRDRVFHAGVVPVEHVFGAHEALVRPAVRARHVVAPLVLLIDVLAADVVGVDAQPHVRVLFEKLYHHLLGQSSASHFLRPLHEGREQRLWVAVVGELVSLAPARRLVAEQRDELLEELLRQRAPAPAREVATSGCRNRPCWLAVSCPPRS